MGLSASPWKGPNEAPKERSLRSKDQKENRPGRVQLLVGGVGVPWELAQQKKCLEDQTTLLPSVEEGSYLPGLKT